MPRKNFNKDKTVYQDQSSTKESVKNGLSAPKTKQVNTVVRFPENPTCRRSHDFAPNYGGQIDQVSSACQQCIEILSEESKLATSTIVSYCDNGLKNFLPFCALWAAALGRELRLTDIDDKMIQAFITHLRDSGVEKNSQKVAYDKAKSVLKKMGHLKWFDDSGIYPRNPYPNSNHNHKGQKALSSTERQRVVQALKSDLNTIFNHTDALTSVELTVCMLAIAVRSGMNPTPLIELPVDCLHPHPIKADRKLLVSYKRRGNGTHVQALRYSKDIELMKTVMPDVADIIEMVTARNQCYREAAKDYRSDLFVYDSHKTSGVTRISKSILTHNISNWVKRHDLTDDDGKPLRLNVMRLRKTFENRIWTLSGQDPWVTAKLGGHSVKVSNDHYLEAPIEAEKNFRFMGQVRTDELLQSAKVKAMPAENTPVSKCRDVYEGQFAPKTNGEPCANFLACIRCHHFVVTEDDLYRLFSFYWLLIYERDHIGARKWSRHFGHIIRMIDRDIVPQFNAETVSRIKAEAKCNPHPFWRNREQLEVGVA